MRGVFFVPEVGRYAMISGNQFLGWTNASTPKLRHSYLVTLEKKYGLYDPEAAAQDQEGARGRLRSADNFVRTRLDARARMRREV